jgi:hypothetical protein
MLSGKISVQKWKIDPSVCSKANFTERRGLWPEPVFENSGFARIAGRKPGSRMGVMRGATRARPLLTFHNSGWVFNSAARQGASLISVGARWRITFE